MNQAKHTPAPWVMKESGFAFHIYGVFKKSKNAFITSAYWSNPEYGASKEEAKANALLIEAAPELLAVLQNIANANPLNWDAPLNNTASFREWAQSRARAAIAKATDGAA